MARIPDALRMRDLKYGTPTERAEADRDAVAALLRAEGRRAEAILLYEGRPKHPLLRQEKAWARDRGAAFHLLSLRRLGVEVTDDDLRACAASAEAAGRWLEARQCFVALQDEAALTRIAERLPPSLRPEPPPATTETA